MENTVLSLYEGSIIHQEGCECPRPECAPSACHILDLTFTFLPAEGFPALLPVFPSLISAKLIRRYGTLSY